VKAGQQETVTVQHASPRSGVSVTVNFPDGLSGQMAGVAGADGTAQIAFTQPPGVFTRHRSTAEVVAEGGSPAGSFRLQQQYTIAFGAIDLTVQPPVQKAGHYISIWVHTSKRAPVTFTVQVKGRKSVQMQGKTGAQGWAGVRYKLPTSARGSVIVRADAKVGHRTLKAKSTAVVA
jgi:hypothetical protein